MSNAEKQRRYRERRDNDPDRRAAYLKKEQETYKKSVDDGKRKLVKDMTPREHRNQRKAWRLRYHNSMEKRSTADRVNASSACLSSSSSTPQVS